MSAGAPFSLEKGKRFGDRDVSEDGIFSDYLTENEVFWCISGTNSSN